MSGSLQTIIVCRPAVDGVGVAPCLEGQAPQLMQAYILDTSAQSGMDAALSGVDVASSSVYFGLFFVLVVGLWSLTIVFKQGIRAFK